MPFWPGVDRWPPPRWVWIAALVMAFVVTPIMLLLGTVGKVVYGAIIVVVLVLGANARFRNMNAEEFWDSRPDD